MKTNNPPEKRPPSRLALGSAACGVASGLSAAIAWDIGDQASVMALSAENPSALFVALTATLVFVFLAATLGLTTLIRSRVSGRKKDGRATDDALAVAGAAIGVGIGVGVLGVVLTVWLAAVALLALVFLAFMVFGGVS